MRTSFINDGSVRTIVLDIKGKNRRNGESQTLSAIKSAGSTNSSVSVTADNKCSTNAQVKPPTPRQSFITSMVAINYSSPDEI
ncbi:MAG: hypothetical protein M2R45_01007 [Verrucomicrobia subdivision 3 bacterium]|nr:hypothetical protein [Limisphaerales bacterium]MCS1414118.1 hypothetical protein [Limisphaerales bacterium]